MHVPDIQRPPDYCQYAAGHCNQSFAGYAPIDGFFAFPSDPPNIAATVQAAVEQLNRSKPNHKWTSWKDLAIAGQIIFCEICRTMRFAHNVIADITTLNFNVIFEIGYGFGLRKPLLLLRDTTYTKDAAEIEELGILDTIGFEPYTNSDQIRDVVLRKQPKPIELRVPEQSPSEAPIYVVLPPVRSEGVVRLLGALNRSAFQYRQFDPIETPRLSLGEIERQISVSYAVIVKLMDPNRAQARMHNARCAFVAGVAMAREKHVLMIQERHVRQPIDYRDVCQSYDNPSQIPLMVERLVRQVATTMHRGTIRADARKERALARLDLGDIAAENEETALDAYFVDTAQFHEALNGHARLVVGRKGTGKSAIFSQLKSAYSRRTQEYLVVDLKPEGYQLRKLVDLMRQVADAGSKEQTLVSFWDYVLLCEMAHKIVDVDTSWAYRDPRTLELFNAVKSNYTPQEFDELADFSERLLVLLARLEQRLPRNGSRLSAPEIASAIWTKDIAPLRDAVAKYLEQKEEVWLLVDNLDKSWPAKGATEHDMLMLRTLLEASRKLQRQLERRKVGFKSVVFIRTDIYEQLVATTPDRGKESVVGLDRSDIEVFKEILRRRAVASLAEDLTFEGFFGLFFDRHVGGEDTFKFLFRHTLGRARDILRLAKKCIEIALNRGRDRVTESDVRAAVAAQSNELLRELEYEIRDTHPERAKLTDQFVGSAHAFDRHEVLKAMAKASIPMDREREVGEDLLWYGFLGVLLADGSELYALDVEYDVDRMLKLAERGGTIRFTIHPAFRNALHVAETSA